MQDGAGGAGKCNKNTRTLPARLMVLGTHVDDHGVEAGLEEVVARLRPQLGGENAHALARRKRARVGEDLGCSRRELRDAHRSNARSRKVEIRPLGCASVLLVGRSSSCDEQRHVFLGRHEHGLFVGRHEQRLVRRHLLLLL